MKYATVEIKASVWPTKQRWRAKVDQVRYNVRCTESRFKIKWYNHYRDREKYINCMKLVSDVWIINVKN